MTSKETAAKLEWRVGDAYRDYEARVRRWVQPRRKSAGPARVEARMRSGLIVIGVLSLALASCTTIPTPQEANDAMLTLQKYGRWAWALGLALIWADLVLPIPQTAVI